MNAEELKALQAPLKQKYREDAASAQATLVARGTIDVDAITVSVIRETAPCPVAGLHVMAGGDGIQACAAEMMLESLISCAGVTFGAVCTAMGIPVTSAKLKAAGDLDFRGTLGVSRDVPIGFTNVTLTFTIDSDEDDAKLSKAVELAERYCVVAQTLKEVATKWGRA